MLIESGLSFWENCVESKVFTMPAGNGKGGTDSSGAGFTRSVKEYAPVADSRSPGVTASAFRASSRDNTCTCSRGKLGGREPLEIRNLGVSSDSLDERLTFTVLPVSLRNTSVTLIVAPPCVPVSSVFASLRGDACVSVHVPFKNLCEK